MKQKIKQCYNNILKFAEINYRENKLSHVIVIGFVGVILCFAYFISNSKEIATKLSVFFSFIIDNIVEVKIQIGTWILNTNDLHKLVFFIGVVVLIAVKVGKKGIRKGMWSSYFKIYISPFLSALLLTLMLIFEILKLTIVWDMVQNDNNYLLLVIVIMLLIVFAVRFVYIFKDYVRLFTNCTTSGSAMFNVWGGFVNLILTSIKVAAVYRVAKFDICSALFLFILIIAEIAQIIVCQRRSRVNDDEFVNKIVTYYQVSKTSLIQNYHSELKSIIEYPVYPINKYFWSYTTGYQRRTFFVDLSLISDSMLNLEFTKLFNENHCNYSATGKVGFYITVMCTPKFANKRSVIQFYFNSKEFRYRIDYVVAFMFSDNEVFVKDEKMKVTKKMKRVNKSSTNESKQFDFCVIRLDAIQGALINNNFDKSPTTKKDDLKDYNNKLIEYHKNNKLHKFIFADQKFIDNVMKVNSEIKILKSRIYKSTSSNGVKLIRSDNNDQRYCLLINQGYGTGKTLGCLNAITELKFKPILISSWKERVKSEHLSKLFELVTANKFGNKWSNKIFYIYALVKGFVSNMRLSVYIVLASVPLFFVFTNRFHYGNSLWMFLAIVACSIILLPNIMLLRKEEKSSYSSYFMDIIGQLIISENLVIVFEDVDRLNGEEIEDSLRLISNMNSWFENHGGIGECRIIINADETKMLDKLGTMRGQEYQEIKEKIIYDTLVFEKDNLKKYIYALKETIQALDKKQYNIEEILKEFEGNEKKYNSFRKVREEYRRVLEKQWPAKL